MSGGHSTPPGSFENPSLIPDDADGRPGGPSEEANPRRRARRRTVTQFPDYASFQRALNRKEELVALMEQILQEQGIHVEDPHNVERAADYYLQKSSEPRILEDRLPWLKEKLSSEREKSRFYQRVLGILKKLEDDLSAIWRKALWLLYLERLAKSEGRYKLRCEQTFT